jgi:hypothetical protein
MAFYENGPVCGSTKIIEFPDGPLWVEACNGCGQVLSDTYVGDDED